MNYVTNAIEGLQEKESLLSRFKLKKKKSSIMQEMGECKLGGDWNAIPFPLFFFFTVTSA